MQDQEIEYIGAKAKVKEARKGERIMRQGEEGEAVVVVVKGEFRVLVAFAEGEDEREVARLRLGDTV
jgi:CRP-like cAMP-binding protein